MNKFFSELERLYFLRDQHWLSHGFDTGGEPVYVMEARLPADRVAIDLVSSEGMVRAMLINFEKASDWADVAHLYESIQSELGLPAPAISVSGNKGYGLWLSLSEPVPVAEASAFLKALSNKYLADIPVQNRVLLPGPDNSVAAGLSVVLLPCARLKASEMWSAFIDPTLGSMFVDEPWLEMAPNLDKQAGILASLESIEAVDFARVSSLLQRPAESEPSAIETAGECGREAARQPSRLNVGEHFSDPESFLLAVMNDSSVSAKHRIKAAKALLKARTP